MSNIHAVKIIYRQTVGGRETTVITENSDPKVAADEVLQALEKLDGTKRSRRNADISQK